MKPLFFLTTLSTGLIFMTGCAPHIDPSTQQAIQPLKPQPSCQASSRKKVNPFKVSFYTNNYPKIPYTIIGEESISKFNQGGIKRQEAHLRESMRELAAAMGGDAVINIKSNAKSISGTVVAFEREKEATLMNEPLKNKASL